MTYIYFVSNSQEEIKIGCTTDLKIRLENLQVGNPEKLKIIYTIPLEDDNTTFEHHIHLVCSMYHIKGEWFKKEVLQHLLHHPWYKQNMVEFK
jgi:hypothetical protein